MIVNTVRTYLEMNAPDDLRPAKSCLAVRLEPVARTASLLRDLVRRVGAPHHWPQMSDEQWARTIASPALAHWIVMIDGEPGGVAGIEMQSHGNVEIRVFGLLHEFIGQGYGGPALTQTVQLAWTRSPADQPVRRVWLHTSSLDHSNALANYRRRGFRPYKTETRRKQIG